MYLPIQDPYYFKGEFYITFNFTQNFQQKGLVHRSHKTSIILLKSKPINVGNKNEKHIVILLMNTDVNVMYETLASQLHQCKNKSALYVI